MIGGSRKKPKGDGDEPSAPRSRVCAVFLDSVVVGDCRLDVVGAVMDRDSFPTLTASCAKALAESAHERGDIPEANYQYGWVDALAAVEFSSCVDDGNRDHGKTHGQGKAVVMCELKAVG